MEILLTLQYIVIAGLILTIPLACYERFYLQSARIAAGKERPELYNQVYELIPLLLIGFFMIFFTLELVLTLATITAVLIVVVAKLYLGKQFKKSNSVILEQANSYMTVLVVIWLIRSFLFQPYVVPTGSLEPTIQPGDFIVVSQYSYGIRMPVSGEIIYPIAQPKRGDIALFRWPNNPETLFIKRVVGIPGDHIVYKNKQLSVNGVIAKQDFNNYDYTQDGLGNKVLIANKTENLYGYKHHIQHFVDYPDLNEVDIIVPQGNYFMMGDNRDNSNDSRSWGLVPNKNLVGKALRIWLSIATKPLAIRFDRIGAKIL